MSGAEFIKKTVEDKAFELSEVSAKTNMVNDRWENLHLKSRRLFAVQRPQWRMTTLEIPLLNLEALKFKTCPLNTPLVAKSNYLTLYSPDVAICTTCNNIQQHWILSTECTYSFRIVLRINSCSCYLPKQHEAIYFEMEKRCFLWGKKRVFKWLSSSQMTAGGSMHKIPVIFFLLNLKTSSFWLHMNYKVRFSVTCVWSNSESCW